MIEPGYPVIIFLVFLTIGTALMVCLIIVLGLRRREGGVRFWTLRLGETSVAFISWQSLYLYLRYMTYSGGGTQEILLKDAICNVVAYLVIIVILVRLDRRHLPAPEAAQENQDNARP